MPTTKHQPRKPIAYSGSGSAVDNYHSDSPVCTDSSRAVNSENWAGFTPTKPDPIKRKVLFSLMHQAQWTTTTAGRDGYVSVPDLKRLSHFLQSDKTPVNKKLKDMDVKEMEKLITAFRGIVKHKWK